MPNDFENIWANIKKGDENAFRRLFDYYYEDLVRFARSFVSNKDEAEDIVQALFVHIWENAGTLMITSSIQSYLFLAIKNRCMNALRSKNVRDKHELLFVNAFLEYLRQEDSEPLELEEELVKSLHSLPPKMKQIIEMKYFGKKKIDQISEQLGVSTATVKTQLQRGKSKLKAFMKPSGT